MNFTILRFDSIDSTNTEAINQARRGADEGLCVIARQQTAGRGRQGRSWVSPHDAGSYLSMVLRPQLEAKHLALITIAAAVAVFDTLAELGIEPDIKWPNDVLVNEKKICGILAETADTERGLAVVVGIGINITSESFPSELEKTATSLESELGQIDGASEIQSVLLFQFSKRYAQLCEPDGAAAMIDEWTSRSSYARGKNVRAILTDFVITGFTDGLEPNGALRVLDDAGTVHLIQAGDVERLRSTE
jgi:BirA family biotin operon repressor/biotin-[acetyl-CoA-carboxylase] ligase